MQFLQYLNTMFDSTKSKTFPYVMLVAAVGQNRIKLVIILNVLYSVFLKHCKYVAFPEQSDKINEDRVNCLLPLRSTKGSSLFIGLLLYDFVNYFFCILIKLFSGVTVRY